MTTTTNDQSVLNSQTALACLTRKASKFETSGFSQVYYELTMNISSEDYDFHINTVSERDGIIGL